MNSFFGRSVVCPEAKELKQRMAEDLVEEGLSYVELCEKYTAEDERPDMEKYAPEILAHMDMLMAQVDGIYNGLSDEMQELDWF